ncbi:MAG: T9SS type A sorting domain-containing protein [Saprospiraceae bacterium]|nr:T9SS type A sorting domain-containing protein [Saprospiraceae bacterium]
MINIDTLYNTLNEAPDSGLVYRFSQVVAVEDPAKPAHIVQVYPSPVQDILTIKMEDQPETQGLYTITDPSGRALRSGNITTEQTQVNVSGLPGGMYFVQVVSRAGIAETRKVWKE